MDLDAILRQNNLGSPQGQQQIDAQTEKQNRQSSEQESTLRVFGFVPRAEIPCPHGAAHSTQQAANRQDCGPAARWTERSRVRLEHPFSLAQNRGRRKDVTAPLSKAATADNFPPRQALPEFSRLGWHATDR
jgi:hypothetical protein